MFLPQIFYFGLSIIGLMFIFHKRNKLTDNDRNNAFSGIIGILATQCLFYWGGFYDKLSWPQFVELGMVWCAIIVEIANHGKPMRWNITLILGKTTITATLLYFGGFFNGIF